MKGSVRLQLRNGNVITGEYEIDEDEYDDIYDAWQSNRPIMAFSNCVVRVSDVLAIEWDEE